MESRRDDAWSAKFLVRTQFRPAAGTGPAGEDDGMTGIQWKTFVPAELKVAGGQVTAAFSVFGNVDSDGGRGGSGCDPGRLRDCF